METLSVTSCVLEKYFDKSILHFNFNDDIKIKIYLPIDSSIVKETFGDYLKEQNFEYRGKQPQYCFTFGGKHLPLKGAISLTNSVSFTACTLLDYIRDYADKSKTHESVPLKYMVMDKYTITKIAEQILELLEE